MKDAAISFTWICGKAILTQSENNPLGPLARLDDGPLFDEPWQAQAVGLAFSLSERGVYSPAEWSQTLGAEHRKILSQGAPDTPQTYYEAVVQALERLLQEKGPVTTEKLENRVSDWRQAYLRTPHGSPVKLEAGQSQTPRKT